MLRRSIAVAVLALVLVASVRAHHGRKYLLTGSYEMPAAGSWNVLFSTERRAPSGEGIYEFEPGILYGITGRWEAELHVHQGIEGGELHTEALGFESRFGLLGDVSEEEEEEHSPAHMPFGVSLLAEYERGWGDHPDNLEGRLIGGLDAGGYSLAGNLIWDRQFGDVPAGEYRYAAGLIRNIAPFLGAGLEFDGSFTNGGQNSITPGIYFSSAERLDLKLGVSFGLSSGVGERVIRLAFVFSPGR